MSFKKSIRIGLIGCGLFGESHLNSFQAIDIAEVSAVYDVDRGRAEALALAYNIAEVSNSIDELCASPQVDAVDVVTSVGAHLEPVIKAFQAGKHVFVEKPLATNLEHCDLMIESADKADRILMVGHILRFETKFAMAKEEIESGQIGRIVSMHGRRNRLKSSLEKPGRIHPAIENSIHDIDLMLWYSGERVVRVRGYGRNAMGGRHHDTFWGILEFEGGALGVVETIWLLPKAAGVLLDDAFQVIGDQGVANISSFPGGLTFWRESGFEIPDNSYAPRLRGGSRGALRDELAYFCNCVFEDRQPDIVTAKEAKNAVRVALALIESAQSDKEVKIEGWDK